MPAWGLTKVEVHGPSIWLWAAKANKETQAVTSSPSTGRTHQWFPRNTTFFCKWSLRKRLLWGHIEGTVCALVSPTVTSATLWFPSCLSSRYMLPSNLPQKLREHTGHTQLPCGNRLGAQSLVSGSPSSLLSAVLQWPLEHLAMETPLMLGFVQVVFMFKNTDSAVS